MKYLKHTNTIIKTILITKLIQSFSNNFISTYLRFLKDKNWVNGQLDIKALSTSSIYSKELSLLLTTCDAVTHTIVSFSDFYKMVTLEDIQKYFPNLENTYKEFVKSHQ